MKKYLAAIGLIIILVFYFFSSSGENEDLQNQLNDVISENSQLLEKVEDLEEQLMDTEEKRGQLWLAARQLPPYVDTRDWKTTILKQFGLQLKHPQNWELSSKKSDERADVVFIQNAGGVYPEYHQFRILNKPSEVDLLEYIRAKEWIPSQVLEDMGIPPPDDWELGTSLYDISDKQKENEEYPFVGQECFDCPNPFIIFDQENALVDIGNYYIYTIVLAVDHPLYQEVFQSFRPL